MGTELQRRGLDTGLPMWSANALFSRPDMVLQIHRDYLAAGADIITTNTFRTTRRTMRRANLPDRSAQLTSTAIRLARQAREGFPERQILIAGSIAPLEDCYRPDRVPSDQELRDEHAELAERLAEGGVDLLLLETMNTVREACFACQAANATGKETIISFVCDKDGALLSGESLAEAVKATAELHPAGLSINCVSPRHMMNALSRLTSAVSHLPSPFAICAYGNVGLPEGDRHGWEFTHDLNEEEYAAHAAAWVRMGVRIIGGCCGTTPAYIEALASVLGKA
jgi:S-methylmethionine-dependent homocysteine/selenocysteine methylase